VFFLPGHFFNVTMERIEGLGTVFDEVMGTALGRCW
jgi:hypothetical protein